MARFDLVAIQSALRKASLDGWLFYDFRGSDPLAYSILGLDSNCFHSRRWFYWLPAQGEPIRIVHAIEAGALDALPGAKSIYLRWSELKRALQRALLDASVIAMQYSPENAIPYISRVDAGTIELVRSLGPRIVSSADLVAIFEATVTPEQLKTHHEAADAIAEICQEAFDEIGRRLAAKNTPTEHDIQQFILKRFGELGLACDHAPIVAIDDHAADPHFEPSANGSRLFAPGQCVLIDLWAKRAGADSIYADITRVAFTGKEPPTDYVEVFSVVREARDSAVDAVRDAVKLKRAVTGAEIDDVCRGVIERRGYGDAFIHRTGHSIHRTTHGNGANIDNLETHDTRLLIPRSIFSIEPGIYLPGRIGVRSEINVYVSEDEAIVTGPEPQQEVYLIRG